MSKDSKVKPSKYNDADTKKEGSPIETPFKHSDARRILRDANKETVVINSDEETLLKK